MVENGVAASSLAAIKQYDTTTLDELVATAASSPRQRSHLNVHDDLGAQVQRLFIATEPATYLRPHRHPQVHKWEFLVVLEGSIDLLVFDNHGLVLQRVGLSPRSTRAVELPPGTWHAYVCREPGTVVLEVKEGAYTPSAAEDFAAWSPPEGSTDAGDFAAWMREAEPGMTASDVRLRAGRGS